MEEGQGLRRATPLLLPGIVPSPRHPGGLTRVKTKAWDASN